jgi:hypothetical protein
MIFIYNCYAGTHSSSLAAAVHLKRLPADRVPTKREILETEFFDKLTSRDFGRMILRGTDEEGNRVFTLGRGPSKLVIPALANVIRILCKDYGFSERIVFSNMSPSVNFPMQIGGFVSRRFGLTGIGRPFLVMGAKQAHQKIIGIVEHTKASAKEAGEKVLVLSNESG